MSFFSPVVCPWETREKIPGLDEEGIGNWNKFVPLVINAIKLFNKLYTIFSPEEQRTSAEKCRHDTESVYCRETGSWNSHVPLGDRSGDRPELQLKEMFGSDGKMVEGWRVRESHYAAVVCDVEHGFNYVKRDGTPCQFLLKFGASF